MSTLLRIGIENAVAGSCIALLVTAASRFGPLRRRPAWVHGLWLLVLLKLVTPSPWRVPVWAWQGTDEPAAVATESEPAEVLSAFADVADLAVLTDTPVEATRVSPPSGWVIDEGVWSNAAPAAVWVWVSGSAAALVLTAVRVRRFQRVIAEGTDPEFDALFRVKELAGKVGLSRVPEVLTVPGGVCPMVWAFGGRPVLVIPSDLWKSLSGTQRSTLIVHELAHLKRGDHLVRLLELTVSVLYWWLPPVRWARRRLHEAEEQCCDAWVVWALPGAARAYAETLLETVDYLSSAGAVLPSEASGFGPGPELKRRLLVILRGDVNRSLGRGGSLLVVGLAATILPWNPTWAQKPKDEAEKPKSEVIVVQKIDESAPQIETIDVRGPVTLVRGRDGKSETEVGGEAGVRDAIDRLRKQREVLAAKGNKEAVSALEHAIESLESLAKNPPKDGETRQVRVVVRHADGPEKGGSGASEKLSAEKAEAHKKLLKELHEVGPGNVELFFRREADGPEKGGSEKKEKSEAAALQEKIIKEIRSIHGDNVHVVVRHADGPDAKAGGEKSAKDSPEKAAAKDQIRDDVKKLNAELKEAQAAMQAAGRRLAETQKRFAEASRKLAEADGQRAKVMIHSNAFSVHDGKPDGVVEYRQAPDGHTLFGGAGQSRAFTFTTPGGAQDARLKELEKKLQQVVEQLESLKKAGK